MEPAALKVPLALGVAVVRCAVEAPEAPAAAEAAVVVALSLCSASEDDGEEEEEENDGSREGRIVEAAALVKYNDGDNDRWVGRVVVLVVEVIVVEFRVEVDGMSCAVDESKR